MLTHPTPAPAPKRKEKGNAKDGTQRKGKNKKDDVRTSSAPTEEELRAFCSRVPLLHLTVVPVTAAVLRKLWKTVRENEPLKEITFTPGEKQEAEIVSTVFPSPCVNPKDDTFRLYLLRNRDITARFASAGSPKELAAALQQHGLAKGDTLIGYHEHNCTGPCKVPGSALLRGVTLA